MPGSRTTQGRPGTRICAPGRVAFRWVNGVGTHFRGVPYGGLKNSGVGREEGLEEMLSYTEIKVINILVK